MAEKTLNIDGKEVKFVCTAGTLRRYRMKFRRDLLADAQKLIKAVQGGDDLSTADLEVFEDVAYIMAKQADDTVPEDPNDWLDGFSVFSVYNVLPEIVPLWLDTTQGIEEAKKNNQ